MKNTPRITALSAAAIISGLLFSACDAPSLGDRYDKSEERTIEDVSEGKAVGTLAEWVPDDATDVRMLFRTTGNERLLRATYDGELPDSCVTIDTPGAPTDVELTEAYSHDVSTQGEPLESFTTAPLLAADWWPEGQEGATTALCGRWWVSQSDTEIFAFAPELTLIADHVARERGIT